MATKTITWPDGSTAVLTYSGQGSGPITVQSDPNNHYESRSVQVTVKTTDGSNIQRTVTIQQAAKVRIDISSALVTASTQTYSGSALTPDVHVILNGAIVDESGYDVTYSDNINAGTANITVTGKGDYEGTAYGTFTINQATGQVTTVPTARSVTYNGNTQYLITAGAGTGTMYYRYKLSTSSTWSSWSSTRARATDAGTYDIEYVAYASSDGNYTTSAVGSLSVTMAKASRTLSFAITYAVVAPSGTVTKTATPSAGSGDGAITYTISSTTYATINSSTGAVTAKTSDGSAVVTATIAEGTNYLSATASYNLYVFATTHNFAYTGSVQNIALPPGSYKLQCWGAQGGSNATDSTYGITAQVGGKGGYAEGVLTIAEQLTLYAFVGGQGGSSDNGGWNCGGGSAGSTIYTSGDITYTTRFACGGGATDFALVTSSMSYSSRRNNRSDASLLSRIIVAGGGSGGAMGCKRSTTTAKTVNGSDLTANRGYIIQGTGKWTTSNNYRYDVIDVSSNRGQTFTINKGTNNTDYTFLAAAPVTTNGASQSYATGYSTTITLSSSSATGIVPSNAAYLFIGVSGPNSTDYRPSSIVFTATTDTTTSQAGYAGGGVNGDGYVNTSYDFRGKQDAAGAGGGAFGKGANKPASTSGYCSGGGGAGWYGGGANNSSTSASIVKQSGGGSGFVNTAASAENRPSGYTGIELDSGTTTIGTSSFPSTGGGTETGHSGNGYARITRLA